MTDDGKSYVIMRVVMTILWLVIAIGGFVYNAGETHLFNPDWTPHARLHIAVFLIGGAVVGLFGIYIIWGATPSRRYSVQLSAILGAAYCLGFILAALLMPIYGGSLLSADVEPNPSLTPASFPQAVGAATLFVLCLYFTKARRAEANN